MPSTNTYSLDYEIDSLSFMVGSFDCTDHLVELSISEPPLVIDTPKLLTGNFRIAYNEQAIALGYTDTEFSEFSNPSRWRKGQQAIAISINGYSLPKFRIENYQWDTATSTGEGSLVQLPSLFQVLAKRELQAIAPRIGGTALREIIEKLLSEVATRLPFSLLRDIATDIVGSYDLPVFFDDIIQLIQQFTGTQQTFMWCDAAERVKFEKVNFNAPPTMVRPFSKFIVSRDLTNVNFAAETVKVTGSKDVAKLPPPPDNTGGLGGGSAPPETDEDGFPKSFTKRKFSTWGAEFADLKDNFGNSLLTAGTLNTPIMSELDDYYFEYGAYADGSKYKIRETIVKQRLAGYMYAKLTDNAGLPLVNSIPVATILEFSSREEIDSRSRTVTTTMGQKYGNAKSASGTTIVTDLGTARQPISEREELNADISPKPPYYVPPSDNNPNSGTIRGIQATPSPEPPQPQADFDYENQIYSGVCNLQPVGWSAFLPRELALDVGFLPNAQVAQILACWIARLEIGRRDASNYRMPIPAEWLARGGRPGMVAYMGDRLCMVDQVVLSITRNDDTEFVHAFEFQGIFLGLQPTLSDPPPPSPVPVTAGLAIVPIQSLIFVAGQAIAPVQMVAINGTPPYSWSAIGLPPGLTISSGGLISGTPAAGNSTATITVTDAIAATANFSLSFEILAVDFPNNGYTQLVRIAVVKQRSNTVTKGLRGFATPITSRKRRTNTVTDVTPPVINLKRLATRRNTVTLV